MKYLKSRIMWLVIVIIILLSLINIGLTIYSSISQEKHINNRVEELVKSLHIPQPIKGTDGRNGIDGITPQKNIDYFDGKNGSNGANGQNGLNGKDGAKGSDGLTPELQCNVEKNRWEVRYIPNDNWKVLNGKPVKCTVKL